MLSGYSAGRDVSRVVERTHQQERNKTQAQLRTVLADEGGMDMLSNGEPFLFSRYETRDNSGTKTKVVNAKIGESDTLVYKTEKANGDSLTRVVTPDYTEIIRKKTNRDDPNREQSWRSQIPSSQIRTPRHSPKRRS